MLRAIGDVFGRGAELGRLALTVARLGRGARSRLGLLFAVLLLPVTERLRVTRGRFALTVAPAGFTIADRSDFSVMVETLIDDDFDIDLGRPRTIVDAGAHAGLFSLYLHDRFPEAKILAVEPSPSTVARLRKNVGGVPRLTVLELALGAEDGTASFRQGVQSWGSSLDPDGEITVETATVASLLSRAGFSGIDLLKMDIEGAEWSAFRTEDDLHGAVHVIGELHCAESEAGDFYRRFPSYCSSVLRVFPRSQLFHLAKAGA
jgi:FkbM family methyltransferase